MCINIRLNGGTLSGNSLWEHGCFWSAPSLRAHVVVVVVMTVPEKRSDMGGRESPVCVCVLWITLQ